MSSAAAEAGIQMDFEKIREILPHQFPFILLDRVCHLQPGSRIVALKNVTGNEFHFLGHFPRMAIMPGVLIVEAAAQASGILWAASASAGRLPSARHHLASANMSFHAAVTPGDQLVIEATIQRRLGRFLISQVKVSVDGSIVARGELTLAQTSESS